ncbi:hypothetical protein N3K66_004782 [Trichothecium roseum]|uniref:Uncharacterized protein n=1 Tax=Trichothecium roseum TaxID=47278 RepID=A0ACC0V274_9HYPO|nr:hypothetical protein N3K66_004782 [Trichothecium roseum]
MPEGRQSPPPERQTGAQQQAPPADGQGTDDATNKQQTLKDQLQNLDPSKDSYDNRDDGEGWQILIATQGGSFAVATHALNLIQNFEAISYSTSHACQRNGKCRAILAAQVLMLYNTASPVFPLSQCLRQKDQYMLTPTI